MARTRKAISDDPSIRREERIQQRRAQQVARQREDPRPEVSEDEEDNSVQKPEGTVEADTLAANTKPATKKLGQDKDNSSEALVKLPPEPTSPDNSNPETKTSPPFSKKRNNSKETPKTPDDEQEPENKKKKMSTKDNAGEENSAEDKPSHAEDKENPTPSLVANY